MSAAALPAVVHECPTCHNRIVVHAQEATVLHQCPMDHRRPARLTAYRVLEPADAAE